MKKLRPGIRKHRDSTDMPFSGFTDAEGRRVSVNLLTLEEPTDWGGGGGLYDAFVEVSGRPRKTPLDGS